MKQSRLAKLCAFLTSTLFSASLFAAQPTIKASELKGVFNGESANGACKVTITKVEDFLVFSVDQNMTVHKSIPVSTVALLQKISGDSCGRVRTNNECGAYTLQDNQQSGAGYDNVISVEAVAVKSQRCLDINVFDASYSEWMGSNQCRINLNGSGKGCGWE